LNPINFGGVAQLFGELHSAGDHSNSLLGRIASLSVDPSDKEDQK
jgi:hypothetical protein